MHTEIIKEKKDRWRTLNIFLFVMMFALRSFTDAIFISKGVESNIWINLKYIVILLAIFLNIMQFIKNKKMKVFTKEIKNILFVGIALFFISCICIIRTNNFNSCVLEEVFKLILPIVYVFFVMNTWKFEDIYCAMKWTLIFSIIGYVIEIGTSNFSIVNIMSMNFSKSYSPFESNFACGTAIAMCAFFMYYRKNKIITALSFLFAIFTFKRLSVLFAIIFLILPKIINVNKNVNKNVKLLCKIGFIVLPLVYYAFLLPSSSELFYKIIGESQRSFTMGRSVLLNYINNNDFRSFGLGSSTVFIGRSMEMDLIKIYIETGIIGLAIFVNGYWECSGNTVYTYIYMLFQFINMVTSHSLLNSFNWILVFVIIGTISYKNNQQFLKISRKGVNHTDGKDVYNSTNI